MVRVLTGLALVISLMFGGSAMAQERELLGSFRDWNAFRDSLDGQAFCYAVSIPEQARLSRRGRQRGEVFFFVSHLPARNIANQPEAILGYPVDEGSTPTIRIGGDTFEMFGRGERIYLLDEGETSALLSAMRQGSRMIVNARSERGTESTDEYSLLGATAALESAAEACQ